MSDFLRNIARRAAGLPAKSEVAPVITPAILVMPPSSPSDSPAASPVAPPATQVMPPSSPSDSPAVSPVAPATAPVPGARPAPAQMLQRYAEMAPAQPPSPLAPTITPRAAPGPPVTIAPITAGPGGSPPSPFAAEPPVQVPASLAVDARFATVPEPPSPRRDSPPAVIHEQATVARINVWGMKPTASTATPAAAPQPRPIKQATSEPDPTVSPVVEKTTRETVMREIIERIYATEPAEPEPAQTANPKTDAGPDRGVELRFVEMRGPELLPQSPQPRVELRGSEAGTIEAPPPEKRTVNVRIGALELKLSPPEAIQAAPEPASGFEGFDEVRTYRF